MKTTKAKYFTIGFVCAFTMMLLVVGNMAGKLKAMEEKETVYLALACSDKSRFRAAIRDNKNNLSVIELSSIELENVQEAMLSACDH